MTSNNPKTKPTNSDDAFLKWLEIEMIRRHMGVNELQRRGGFSPGYVTRVFKGDRAITKFFVEGIAKAFDLPIQDMYLVARFIPEIPDLNSYDIVRLHMMDKLSSRDKGIVDSLIHILLEMEEKNNDDESKGEEITKEADSV